MALNKKYRTRVRNRIQITLTQAELRQVEEAAAARGMSTTRFARDVLIAEVTDQSDKERQEQNASMKDLLEAIISRFAKLERVQRTIVLNTAHARGFAVGSLRTAPAESRKTIEQEVLKNFNEQKNFFFNLFPEQRDGDPKDGQPKGSRES
jgi:hypothetical protein